MNLIFCIYFYLEQVELILPDIDKYANCSTRMGQHFSGFYDSIKTRWNRIGRIKLEISSSFKPLLFTKSCKVFLDFTCKCRCWVSVRYYRFSDLLFYYSYGVFVAKNYKTGALVVRIIFIFNTLRKFFKSCPLFKS